MRSAEGNGSQNPLLPRVPNPDPEGFTLPWGELTKVIGGREGIESYFEPRNKLKPSEFFTKQCQEGTTLGRHRTQRDPKKSSFLVGT